MSDTSGAFPPPPPPSVPPPTYGAPAPPPANIQLPPGYKLPPGYQGPTAPDYSQPYQYQPAAYQPFQQAPPQPVNPGAVVFGSTSAILYQFGGPAAYAVIVGVAGIALPLFAGYYFRVLPIFGIIAGARAVMGGRVLGGAVGIGVNALAGLLSLVSAGLIG